MCSVFQIITDLGQSGYLDVQCISDYNLPWTVSAFFFNKHHNRSCAERGSDIESRKRMIGKRLRSKIGQELLHE